MTENQVIAEYILQKIKYMDLVEFTLEKHEIIKGYILDKDVFGIDFLEDKKRLRAKIGGYEHIPNKFITIQLWKDKDDTSIETITHGLLNFNLLPKPTFKFLVKQIVSIKKLKIKLIL